MDVVLRGRRGAGPGGNEVTMMGVMVSVDGDGDAFEPGEIRYIKLGTGGAWAAEAIEQGILPLGYHEIDHELCLQGSWEAVRAQLVASGWTTSGASQALRELWDFHELPADTLWVTFADGNLY